MDKEVVKFDPTREKLTKAVEISKKIVAKDSRDLKQIELVKRTRKELRSFEIVIEKDGLKFRAEANAYAKEVSRQEKELKKITSPEIERLKEIEEKSEALLLKDRRLKDLPEKKKQLEDIGDNITMGDDYLLGLGESEFMTYFNQRVADKNEADRIAEENRASIERAKIQAEQGAQAKKLEEEKEAFRIKQEEQDAEAKKKRKAEQDKIDEANRKLEDDKKAQQDKIDEENRKLEADKLDLQHQKELKEAEEKSKIELDKKIESDRLKAIEDKKAEDEKLSKRKAYMEFLKENGYTEETKENYHIEKLEDKIVLYKKVGEFEI